MKGWGIYLVAAAAMAVMPRGGRCESAAAGPVKAEPAKIAQAREPEQIVRETVDRVIAILKDPQYKDPALKLKMREKVRNTILQHVDMNTVSVLTLANYRSQFSAQQFKMFSDLLAQLLFTTYIKHLEAYKDEKVVIVGTDKESDVRRVVRTKTVTDASEFPVEFSFIKMKDRWMLYDMHVEGVSLVKNYRSQFREILVKRSVDQFLEQLRQKVSENEKAL